MAEKDFFDELVGGGVGFGVDLATHIPGVGDSIARATGRDDGGGGASSSPPMVPTITTKTSGWPYVFEVVEVSGAKGPGTVEKHAVLFGAVPMSLAAGWIVFLAIIAAVGVMLWMLLKPAKKKRRISRPRKRKALT